MGLLDDLAMGFGLKERTEDYDARTARNIAVSEQYDNEFDRIRARQSGDYDVTRGGAAQFLGSRGRDNYNPQIAQDNRSFGQRLLFSPESAPSPTPYAIGPLTMDQPLPKFGILGMLSGLGGLLGGNTQQMGQPQTAVRPDGFTPPTSNVAASSGKYPQFLYDRGYSDAFLDGLPQQDLDFLLSFNPAGQ
jgi:hypothetical protein